MQHYRAIVIGGGVVGASILYHLARQGWTDTLLIERNVLTAGSSWHAAGDFHRQNANADIAALQAYTIDLLEEVERESGVDIGRHLTGGISYACNPDRWDALRSSIRVQQAMGIDDVRLIDVEEILSLCPIVRPDGIIGGMYSGRTGHLDPSAMVHAYAKAARLRGAAVMEHNRVVELRPRTDGGWTVVTEQGTLGADHVVNAGGLWARKVGRMAGVDLPVTPLEHMYLVTESIPQIEALDVELPTIVDLDGFSYLRQEQKGLMLGIYEAEHRHWHMEGAPWDYGFDLIQEDPDRIAAELIQSFERYPALETAGVRRWVNGAFTFTPDGNPLVGPVRGLDNYWVACGVMAGFSQGGGVGKALAEWMTLGEPEDDIFGMDVARYGRHAVNRRYLKETTGQFYSRRFVLTYPNQQLPAGRPYKVPPAYDAMTGAGARWAASWGLEVPLYFAPPDYEENHTLRRSTAFDIVSGEVHAARHAAGLLDISGYARYEVSGPGAEAWLARVTAGRMPRPGRAALAPMLGQGGRLKGDLTVLNWGDETWWLMGSYYLREWHMRWWDGLAAPDVTLRDISDDWVGLSLMGPAAREILQSVTEGDLSNAGLPFFGCATLDVGLTRARVARMSVTGERGFELNVPAACLPGLRQTLLQAGRTTGLREIGFAALGAMRLEKSFGIWNREFTQSRTPAETGLDRFVDYGRGGFIGHEAAQAERDRGSAARRLVTLEVDAVDADASGHEPVWLDGRIVGHVTSGGYAHSIGRSLALALVEVAAAAPGTGLTTHVVGEERSARVIPDSPYDPEGLAMRG